MLKLTAPSIHGAKRLRCFKVNAFVLLFSLMTGQASAIESEVLVLPQLKDNVEIITDQWGIPHIYANNQHDLFFAQGYNAAKNRLFQFEIWRRRALGLMAEIQGEKAVQHDIGARLLKFRGNRTQELQYYHEDSESIIAAFVNGVNTAIQLARENPKQLPIEFQLLGIKPGFWTAEVVVSRHNALTGGAQQELMVANLITTIGAEKADDILSFSQPPYLKPKGGIELNQLNDNLLALYTASRTPPTFTEDDLSAAAINMRSSELSLLNGNHRAPFQPSQPLQDLNTLGSNNWIIAGNKTASGYPIMANDPHRSIQMPSLRYWAHLVAPGWNVIGGGEPVLPGISIGHNDFGAWGLTIFPIDQEDIYVYDINPDNANQYRYQGQWESMTIITEKIPVKQASVYQATLKYTRHGPVIYEDEQAGKAYALRAAWLDVGAAPYLASLRMNQATTWEEFREACTYSGLPGENMIWADQKGNIGWQAVGLTPIRIGWDGLLPVPGDGRYEWAGYVPIKSMPHLLNPPEGHWQSANHNNVPDDYPNIFSYFSATPYRLNRIQEVLETGTGMTVEHSMVLQNDVQSLPARALVPLLSGLTPTSNTAKDLVNQLLHWDYNLHKDAIEAAVYTHWEQALSARLALKADAPFVSMEKVIAWLTKPDLAPRYVFDQAPVATRNALLIESLEAAIETLSHTVGPNPKTWRYGQEKLKHSKITHPLSHLVNKDLQNQLDVGPVPRGGDSHTVNLNRGDGNQSVGASFRIITDTSHWDLTRGANTPGQSGDPDSPHYKDLFNVWAEGDYFPVYYTREKIEAAARHKTLLKPPPK